MLTVPAITFGLAISTLLGGGYGLANALAGLGLAVAALIVPVGLRVLGAGDLKLLAAIGSLGGPHFVLWSTLLSLAVSGVLAAVVLLSRRQLFPVVGGLAVDAWIRQRPHFTSSVRLPFAIPISAGVLLTMVLW